MAQATGREQRKKTQRAQLRAPNLSAFYDRRISSIEPGEFDFRIVLVRPAQPRESRYLTLTRNTTEVDWSDAEGSTLSGSLTVRRSGVKRINSVPVVRGDRVRLLVHWGGRWRRLWDLRIPDVPPVDLKTGSLSVTLEDDLTPLSLTEREWEFKKDKRHPDGWTMDEIIRYVCKKCGVRPGRISEGRRKIKKLKLKASGLEVIRKAVALEKEKTAQKFVIRFRDTRLDVLPYRRPGTLYTIKGIEKGGSTQATGKPRPVTQIVAKGRIRSGEKTRKVEETIRSVSAIKRFGKIEKEKDYGRVDSRADLREQAKRDLAEAIKLERTATLTLPGIPFLEKGSAVRWVTTEPGWSGKVGDTARDRSFAFVTGANHILLPSSYETEITIAQDDPYFEDRKRRDEERRDKKKKERGGRKPKEDAE